MANVKSEYMKLYPAHAGFSTKTVNSNRAYDRPDIDLPAKVSQNCCQIIKQIHKRGLMIALRFQNYLLARNAT